MSNAKQNPPSLRHSHCESWTGIYDRGSRRVPLTLRPLSRGFHMTRPKDIIHPKEEKSSEILRILTITNKDNPQLALYALVPLYVP